MPEAGDQRIPRFHVAAATNIAAERFGTALTTLPLLRALQEGCRWAVLHFSSMGLPVYQRIGFDDLRPLRVYMPGGATGGVN